MRGIQLVVLVLVATAAVWGALLATGSSAAERARHVHTLLLSGRRSDDRASGTVVPTADASPPAAADCPQLPDLGFDYPPLRAARAALRALACGPHPLPSRAVSAEAYRQALRRLEGGDAAAGVAGAWQALAQPAAAAAGVPGAQYGGGGSDAAAHALLERFLSEALVQITVSGEHLLACSVDHTLPLAAAADKAAAKATAAVGRVLFASNLSDSGHLVPNLIIQLLQLALLLPPGHLAVSVFESGSSDLTRQWLALLRMLLVPLRVPQNITLGGALRRRRHDRIEFMASLRNAALEPFLESSVGKTTTSSSSSSSSGGGAAGPAQGRDRGTAASGASPWRPDRVVFANDVFFCAGDALRLLAHGADLACGLDFYTGAWHGRADVARGGAGAAAGAGAAEEDEDGAPPGDGTGSAGEGVPGAGEQPGRRRRAQARRLAEQRRRRRLKQQQEGGGALQQEQSAAPATLRFYDKWVARDISGRRFRNLPPYVHHAPSRTRLAAGLPFPALCCWDGLAAFSAAPFLSGLRFRAAAPGECRASECSLFCDDLARLGRGSVVIDPAVRVAYEWQQAEALAAAATPHHALHHAPDSSSSSSSSSGDGAVPTAAKHLPPVRSWAEVSAAGALPRGGTGEWRPRWDREECCDLAPGKTYVDFRRDCRPHNALAVNHTASFLATRRRPQK